MGGPKGPKIMEGSSKIGFLGGAWFRNLMEIMKGLLKMKVLGFVSGGAGGSGGGSGTGNGVRPCSSEPPIHTRRGPG